MSKEKQKKRGVSTGKTLGAAMVALSGFVPMPSLYQTPGVSSATRNNGRGIAMAKTLAIPLDGSAISGIALAGPVSLKFGKVVASGLAGTFGVTVGGAANAVNAAAVSGQAQGKIGTYTAAVTAPLHITLAKVGNITLTGAAQKVKLAVVKFTGLGGAALNVTTAGGTTLKKTYTMTAKKTAGVVNIGASLKWAGLAAPPLGNIPGGRYLQITINY